jgi:WD40 repeat protein/energy-coupling factor transporter ATP-binding protein EcfA2
LPTPVSALKGCPYPGLRSFARDESELFFGRDSQIDRLLELLQKTRFLAVVGPSGCGKSSLIKAGLMADLEGGLMDYAGARWEMAEMRPGNHPFAALADALVTEEPLRSRLLTASTPNDEAVIGFLRAALRLGPMGLVEVLRESNLPPDTNYFLLVDQFEEIFAARQEGAVDETDAFVALLLATAAQRELPVYVVVTMRTDWLGECPVFQGLPEEINKSLFLAPRLTRHEKREAIVGPAKLLGGDIDEELLNHLLNETGPSPDQLPLLQHSLMRMWQLASEEPSRVEPICLMFRHYEAAGGFRNGLSKHAGEAYDELTDEQKRIAQVLFRALSDFDANGRERRRFASVGTIAKLAGVSVEKVIEVADAFRRAERNFLTPPCNQALSSDSLLDISHEALIRNWDKLAGWAEAEAKSAKRYEWLKQTAGLERTGEASLLNGIALENALEWRRRENPSPAWAERYGTDFELAMSFLDRSEQAKRASRRQTIIQRASVCLIVVAALALGCGGYAIWSEKERQERLRSQHDRYFEKGTERLEDANRSPTKHADALRDFAKALRAWRKTPEAAKAAADLLGKKRWCPPMTPPLVYKPSDPLLAATFSPNDEPIAVARSGELVRWTPNRSAAGVKFLAEVWKSLATTQLASASFSSDGRWLLFTPDSEGADAQLWQRIGDNYRYHQSLPLTKNAGTVTTIRQLAWSGDARSLVVISGRPDQSNADVFQLQDGKYLPVVPNPFREAVAASFNQSDGTLATADRDGGVHLWDTSQTPFVCRRSIKAGAVRPAAIEFVPGTESLVATVFGAGSSGGYWLDTNIVSPGPKTLKRPQPQDVFMKFAFAPRSGKVRFAVTLNSRIVFISADARTLDIGEELHQPKFEPMPIRGLAAVPVFNRDGTKLLTLSGNAWNAWDTVRIWDVRGPKAPDKNVNPDEFDRVEVPVWLGDLAMVVSGFCSAESDEEEPLTLEQIHQGTHPHDIKGPHAYLWHRVIGELPSSQQSNATSATRGRAPVSLRHSFQVRKVAPTNPAMHGNLAGTAKKDGIQ